MNLVPLVCLAIVLGALWLRHAIIEDNRRAREWDAKEEREWDEWITTVRDTWDDDLSELSERLRSRVVVSQPLPLRDMLEAIYPGYYDEVMRDESESVKQ